VDVKQWTNCRVGMLGWALLTIVYFVAGLQMGDGFTPAASAQLAHAVLTNVYLLKFFRWETGYFNTLDITLDRAGFMLCWGCLCYVQSLYTFTAYYMVGNPRPRASYPESLAVILFGCLAILLNYISDRQKEIFRAAGGKCHIWGRPAKFIDVQYTNYDGKIKKSRLLTSGFWGMSRHMNYVFEIMVAFAWCLPAGMATVPFLYFFWIVGLLVHRTLRDEAKCSAKYGEGWDKYCKAVPYRLIPGVF